VGIGGDYFVSRNFSDRLFTNLGFEEIISRYPTNPLHSSVFLARLKNLEYWVNTKFPHISTFFGGGNTGEVNKALAWKRSSFGDLNPNLLILSFVP
jgi:hypothetical protein